MASEHRFGCAGGAGGVEDLSRVARTHRHRLGHGFGSDQLIHGRGPSGGRCLTAVHDPDRFAMGQYPCGGLRRHPVGERHRDAARGQHPEAGDREAVPVGLVEREPDPVTRANT